MFNCMLIAENVEQGQQKPKKQPEYMPSPGCLLLPTIFFLH
jgi:hypothetical protein